MSKMENLGDFSDFRLSAPRALFGIVPSWEAESLATQGIAVFGKKSENLRPFWPAKRDSTFCSIPSWKDFVNFSQDGSIKNDFLYWGKGNSLGEFFLKGRVPFSRLRSRMGYAIMEGAKTMMWYKKGAPLCYQHRRAPLYHSSHHDYQSRCDSLIGKQPSDKITVDVFYHCSKYRTRTQELQERRCHETLAPVHLHEQRGRLPYHGVVYRDARIGGAPTGFYR